MSNSVDSSGLDQANPFAHGDPAFHHWLLFGVPSLGSIYLAGPDVFRPDAIERGQYLKQLCKAEGFVGLFPFDNEVSVDQPAQAMAHQICHLNMRMVRSCSAVLANLNDFRGAEPDSGTCFEIGMAVALGKPVWVYFDDKGSLRDQVDHNEKGFDQQGMQVEDFGLPRNLMMACTWAGFSHNAEDAVKGLAAHLRTLIAGPVLPSVLPKLLG